MKNSSTSSKIESYPVFDDSILSPGENEVLRVIQVSPLNEFRFRDYCNDNGIVNYLPLRKAWKVHNVVRNGKSYVYSREVLRPMFPSYVFVKATVSELRCLYDSKILIRFLQPDSQKDFIQEIRTVRIVETVGLNEKLEVHKDIPEGARFLIQSGVWEGVTGWLSRKNDVFKWTVSIEICERLVTVVIDPTQYKMTRLDD